MARDARRSISFLGGPAKSNSSKKLLIYVLIVVKALFLVFIEILNSQPGTRLDSVTACHLVSCWFFMTVEQHLLSYLI